MSCCFFFFKLYTNFSIFITDPYDVIRLFPSLLPQYSQDDSPVSDGPSGKIGNRDFEKSLPALIEYLTAVIC